MKESQLEASARMVHSPPPPMFVTVPAGCAFCDWCERYFWRHSLQHDIHARTCHPGKRRTREYEIVRV